MGTSEITPLSEMSDATYDFYVKPLQEKLLQEIESSNQLKMDFARFIGAVCQEYGGPDATIRIPMNIFIADNGTILREESPWRDEFIFRWVGERDDDVIQVPRKEVAISSATE